MNGDRCDPAETAGSDAWALKMQRKERWIGGNKVADPAVVARMRKVMAIARDHTLTLLPFDFLYDNDTDELTIDGMPADEWLDALTMD